MTSNLGKSPKSRFYLILTVIFLIGFLVGSIAVFYLEKKKFFKKSEGVQAANLCIDFFPPHLNSERTSMMGETSYSFGTTSLKIPNKYLWKITKVNCHEVAEEYQLNINEATLRVLYLDENTRLYPEEQEGLSLEARTLEIPETRDQKQLAKNIVDIKISGEKDYHYGGKKYAEEEFLTDDFIKNYLHLPLESELESVGEIGVFLIYAKVYRNKIDYILAKRDENNKIDMLTVCSNIFQNNSNVCRVPPREISSGAYFAYQFDAYRLRDLDQMDKAILRLANSFIVR